MDVMRLMFCDIRSIGLPVPMSAMICSLNDALLEMSENRKSFNGCIFCTSHLFVNSATSCCSLFTSASKAALRLSSRSYACCNSNFFSLCLFLKCLY